MELGPIHSWGCDSLSIQIKVASLVIRAFLSRFEIPRPRPSSSSGQGAGTSFMTSGVESFTSNAKLIGDIAIASAFNLGEVKGIDLEFFGIKAAGQNYDKTPYRNVYGDHFAQFN